VLAWSESRCHQTQTQIQGQVATLDTETSNSGRRSLHRSHHRQNSRFRDAVTSTMAERMPQTEKSWNLRIPPQESGAFLIPRERFSLLGPRDRGLCKRETIEPGVSFKRFDVRSPHQSHFHRKATTNLTDGSLGFVSISSFPGSPVHRCGLFAIAGTASDSRSTSPMDQSARVRVYVL
jgi:hypothetical protein